MEYCKKCKMPIYKKDGKYHCNYCDGFFGLYEPPTQELTKLITNYVHSAILNKKKFLKDSGILEEAEYKMNRGIYDVMRRLEDTEMNANTSK